MFKLTNIILHNLNDFCIFNTILVHSIIYRSRDSAVSIATSYGLDDRGVGVRIPVGSKIISSPLWGPPNILFNGYRGFFLRGKAAGAWSWPTTSNYCRGQENVDLYIHSLIRLHGVVLNLLSTGTTSPFLHTIIYTAMIFRSLPFQ
jgi:hypothetical protein